MLTQTNLHRFTAWAGKRSFAQANYGFTYAFYTLSAFVGSVSSVLITGALVWAIIRLSLKHFYLSANFHLRAIAAAFALYPAAELISVVVNGRGIAGLISCGASLLTLAILPVSSRLMLSSARDIANAAGRGAAVGSIITLVYCGIQIGLMGFERAHAGSGNASVLALFALILCIICLSLLPVIAAEFRNLLWLGAASSFCAVILSGTRAAWVAAALAITAALWPMRGEVWRSFVRLNLLWKVVGAISIIGLAALVIFPRIGVTIDSLNGISSLENNVSISQRLFMWQGGISQVFASPIFGYGPDSAEQMLAAIGGNPPLGFSHYHNIFLTAAIRGGLIEVVALLCIFASLLWVAFKKSNSVYQKAGQTLLFALCVSGGMAGMANVLLTHDITSAVFIYTAIIGLCLSISSEDELS